MLIDGVHGILTDAGVEGDTVQQILTMLDDARAGVETGGKIKTAPAASFGGAPTATELALHAGKAHDHVVAAMSQMVAGLQGYYDGVEHFRRDVHETDAGEATRYTRSLGRTEQVEVSTLLDLGASCTQSSTFHAEQTCEVPSGEDGR